MIEPKILFYDIESAGVNALKSDLGFVIIFGFKWAHERQAHSLTIDPESLKKFRDRDLLKEASKLITEADLVVTHYGSIFDRRFINGRLLINKLPPIPFTKMRDTCMISRAVANFSSNRLKHLAKILNLRHQKLENNWPVAWFKVMQGDLTTLDTLAKYCRGDVLALEDLYFRLRPFDNAHPRIVDDRSVCGSCGGKVEYRGFAYVGPSKYRRYVCKKCHKWSRERNKVKGG